MKDKNFLLKILKQHNLRRTASRLHVLEAFAGENNSLTHNEIEEYCKGVADRVTVYRTLSKFTEEGLLTKVPTIDGPSQYLLNYSKEDEVQLKTKTHQHLHFSCKSCGNTFCLDDYQIEELKLPEGFSLESLSLVAIGKCDSCS